MQWEIQDFKGLAKAKLDLSPSKLTVLAGANSSGKSSIVQSVLLAAQSSYHDGPVVLNGPLVRLGEAGDLVRGDSEAQFISLKLHSGAEDEIETSSNGVVAQLDLIPTLDDSALRVKRVLLRSQKDSNDIPLLMDRDHSRTSDLKTLRGILRLSSSTDFLHIKTLASSPKRALRTYVGYKGLSPTEVVQLHSPLGIASRYRQALQPILNEVIIAESVPEASRNSQMETQIPFVIREFLSLIDRQIQIGEVESPHPFQGILGANSGNPYRFRNAWRELGREDRKKAIDLAVEARSRSPFIRLPLSEDSGYKMRSRTRRGLLEIQFEELISESIHLLRLLMAQLLDLTGRVQYLGPLRDEPRVVWSQWNELARGLPVGTRGEFSAVVLSRSSSHVLRYVTPKGKALTGTLDQAVNEWLSYLDIGESVSYKSLGKLGVGMEVKVGGKSRDLTAVGVGVSQALPLVVAVLAVPHGSIFIVEQPELHLHPAVQARLADLLLNARPDLTVVVETHSEALITRIRRRVAENLIDPARVTVTFVEATRGGTVTRDLRISEYGDLSDWPQGFLSGPDDDSSAIIEANLARIRKKTLAED